MSLKDYTECDLCADTAKIDIAALDEQLRYRFFSLVRQIHNITAEIGYVFKLEDMQQQVFETACHKSKTLQSLIKQLAITAELADTIQKSGSRQIISVNLLKDNED